MFLWPCYMVTFMVKRKVCLLVLQTGYLPKCLWDHSVILFIGLFSFYYKVFYFEVSRTYCSVPVEVSVLFLFTTVFCTVEEEWERMSVSESGHVTEDSRKFFVWVCAGREKGQRVEGERDGVRAAEWTIDHWRVIIEELQKKRDKRFRVWNIVVVAECG